MSSASVDGHTELKGFELCLYCGLCCTGAIFDRAALKSDEIRFAKDHGLQYFTTGNREFAFHLPCHLYLNNKCSIYSNRPNACKRYRCDLLKRLMNGDLYLEDGKLIVFRVKSLMNSIDKQTSNVEPSADFRQRVIKFLDLNSRNPMSFRDPVSLLKDIESFYIILHRYIEKRAS